MKLFATLSHEDFVTFQKENMDAALSLIGDGLRKPGLRDQVAARLLGFRTFESIAFKAASHPAWEFMPSTSRDYVDIIMQDSPLVRRLMPRDSLESYMSPRLFRARTNKTDAHILIQLVPVEELLDIVYHQHHIIRPPKPEDCIYELSFDAAQEDYRMFHALATERVYEAFAELYSVFYFPMDAALVQSLFEISEHMFAPSNSKHRIEHFKALLGTASFCMRASRKVPTPDVIARLTNEATMPEFLALLAKTTGDTSLPQP